MNTTLRAVLIALAAGVFLPGCATAPRIAQEVLVPTPVPCQAAQELPTEPPRTLTLNAQQPGAAVQAYVANRTRWIGYADALRERLIACK